MIRKRERETEHKEVAELLQTFLETFNWEGGMQNFCPRELWASFAMWMADKTRTPDPETLLFYFLGKWRCIGETWEILECAKGCFSRKRKRTKQENSWYRMVYLPQLGDVRGKAKKVKEEKLKLPYGHCKPRVLIGNTDFIYIWKTDKRLWGNFLESITN